MSVITDLIDAVGRLLVVALAAYLVWSLRKPLAGLLARRGSEVSAFGVTIKVGDEDVPLQNAANELRRDLDDVQAKMKRFQEWQKQFIDQLPTRERPTGMAAEPVATVEPMPRPRRLLWVDDIPANNANLASKLQGQGVTVFQAASTPEGLRLLHELERFDMVITDMGRQEGTKYNPTAGLDLIEEVRKSHPELAVIVYSTRGSLLRFGKELERLEVTAQISSPVDLLTALQIEP